MKFSLYVKFILGYLAFGLTGFVCIATISSRLTYNHLISEQSQSLYTEANLLAQNYSTLYKGNSSLDLDLIAPQLNAIAAYLNCRIIILDRQGTIILDTNSTAFKGLQVKNFDPTDFGNSYYQIDTFYDTFPEQMLSVISPITGNLRTYGYVTIHLPLSSVLQTREQILRILYVTAAILYILSLTILLVFAKTVYLPLKKITYATKRYADGDLTYQLELDTGDEMGYLAATLNYMSNELNEIESYQKKFISNVSHDFRSPLTSIKGYLEAIIDGTIPPQMQEKYLKIVIAETERLNKLTSSMLLLNDLGSKSTYLTKSNFDIHRIITDTAAAFEGTCNVRDIILDLTFADEMQMVCADMEKIQQVLYNLIDNAIKFSYDSSVIYIETRIRNEKIFVSVKDTGVGIPTTSLKKIWERFYKTDSSRGRDKKGTGLGLAIVREIIQAHGENIDVVSTQGVGTEFIFSLSKAKGE